MARSKKNKKIRTPFIRVLEELKNSSKKGEKKEDKDKKSE